MRIDSIDLLRYGHFCGSVITLPKRQPDYFVFYGNNEAGKSTLLRGISALFFGVPAKTPDVHSCKGPELRIGASISDGAQSFSFRRRKGSSGTLLNPEEVQLQENALSPFLRELDRQRFEQFFGLDHHALREGGEEILHGKGDVGSALFQAVGLLELRKVLSGLDDEAKELFSPKSKGRVIGGAIDEYRQARLEVGRLAISGTAVKDLQTRLEQAKEKHETLKNEAQSLHQELAKLRRIAGNKSDVARLQELRSTLLTLASVPTLPPGIRKQRDEASANLIGATTQIESLKSEIAQRKERIKNLPLSTSLKAHSAQIEKLNGEIGDYIRSVSDLRKRTDELDDAVHLAEEEWKEIWRKRPISDAEELRSVYARKAEILDLITDHARLSTLFEQATEQVREGKEQQERLGEELALLPEPPDPATLIAIVESAKSLSGAEAATARLKSDIARLRGDTGRELDGLALFSGTAEELEKLKTPLAATVERYAREWETVAIAKKEQEQRLSAVADTVKEKRGELERYASKVGKAGENQLNEARARRDRLWQLIRSSAFDQTLSPQEAQQQSGASAPLPESFGQQLRLTDEIADRRFNHAKEVAIQDRLAREIDSAGADRVNAEEELALLEAAAINLHARWCREWSALSAPPLSPSEMKEWMQSRQAILELLAKRREKENELALLQDRISEAVAQIRGALEHISSQSSHESESLGVLIQVAEGVVREIGDRRRRIQEIRRDLQLLQLEKREAKLQECKHKLTQWSEQWKPLVRALMLPEISPPKQVREALEVLEKVFDHLKDADRLRHRVKRIGDNIGDFEGKTAQLVAAFDPGLAVTPPESAVAQLHAKYVESGQAETERNALEAENAADETALISHHNRAQSAASRLASLRQLANCEDDLQLEATLSAAEQKSAKQSEYDSIAASLIKRNATPDLKQIEDEASGCELDQLESELASRQTRCQKLEDEELFQAASEYGKLSQEFERLQGSEQSALQAQKAEAAVAKLRPAVAQYVRLRLASEVLQRAMKSYREKHQGAVLQRASELFSCLTLQEHSGLTTAFGDGDKQVLVAVRKNKEQVEVDGLSDGTRDQLYLSLRLAAIEDHVARVAPCPVILDDILINSDDTRAAAALQIFSDLAKQTQVLLFTHHRRSAELAVNAGAQMIELGSLAAAAGK